MKIMMVVYGQRVFFYIFLLKIAILTYQNQITIATDSSEECGVSKALLVRVVGGVESPVNAWPWMAAIFMKKDFVMAKVVFCGGAVISHHHILTAGHCVEGKQPDDLVVHLGEHDILSDSDGTNPVDFELTNIFIHEKYRNGVNHYDIAVMKVSGRIDFSNAIRPVCLPTKDMYRRTFEQNQPYMAGWGRLAYRAEQSSRLRHVQLQVESNEICGIAYSSIIQIRSNQLCAGYRLGGRDACQGDSGGPLVIPINNTWYAIGVVSVGIRCAEPGFPGIFSRITAYIDWLQDIIQIS